MLSLMIAGFNGEASRVTDILGLTPSLVRSAGELTPTGRPARRTLWLYTVEHPEVCSGHSHNEAVRSLLALIADRTERFVEVRRVLNPETMTITGGFYYAPDEQAGLWLDADQMRVLADSGIGWGIDIFRAPDAQP
jgi:hypothetical protein